MSLIIQIVMLLIGGLILIIYQVEPTAVVQGSVFQAGMPAVVAIYGIAWLSDTCVGTYITGMKDTISIMVKTAPGHSLSLSCFPV